MTNTEHTPGPLIYTLDARGVCGIHGGDNAMLPVRIGEVRADTQKQAEAIARLIVAAPAQTLILGLAQQGLMTLAEGEAEFDGVMYWFDPRQPDWSVRVVCAIGWDTARAASAESKAAGVASNPAKATPRLRETLEDVAEWLETGMIDGVHFDEASVLADIRDTLAPALSPPPATPPTGDDPAKKPYSVLLLYPDNANDDGTETYYTWVEALDPIQAVTLAQREAVAANECVEIQPDDFAPLLVTAGHHDGQPLYNV